MQTILLKNLKKYLPDCSRFTLCYTDAIYFVPWMSYIYSSKEKLNGGEECVQRKESVLLCCMSVLNVFNIYQTLYLVMQELCHMFTRLPTMYHIELLYV